MTDIAVRDSDITIDDLAEIIENAAHAAAEAACKPLLERLAILEAKPAGLRDAGIWRDGNYIENDLVSHAGSLWCCKVAATSHQPGQSSAWRMLVKPQRRGTP